MIYSGKEVWAATQLIEKKRRLQEKMKTLPNEQLREYIILDTQLQALQQFLFGKRE